MLIWLNNILRTRTRPRTRTRSWHGLPAREAGSPTPLQQKDIITQAHTGKDARATRDAGFTLPELLIALAVFVSVMGGVALLFVNSMRLTRQGFLNQEAFEEAQSATKIVERDLTRAFTARQYGDYYHFYGTPIGFTFVGLASPDERPADNLARVTYVVYREPTTITETERLQRQQNGEQVIGNPWVNVDNETQSTYSLLRLVEPGRDTLDDFPVVWDELRLGDPESPSSTTAGELINGMVTEFIASANTSEKREILQRNEEEIRNAIKREFWIRMLAGGDDELGIPNAWDPNVQVRTVPLDDGNRVPVVNIGVPWNANQDLFVWDDPRDYVVTEHLVNAATVSTPQVNDLNGDGVPDFFSVKVDTVIPDENVAPELLLTDTDVGIGNGFNFFKYAVFESRLTPSPLDAPDAEEIRPVDLRFWNDWRNIMSNTQTGSPLFPRIPARVTTHFTFFYESPYPNVPDFVQTFDQSIDIPSGFRRFPAE